MLLILGLRSDLTDWCRDVVTALLRRAGTDFHQVTTNEGGALLRELLAMSSQRVFLVNRPDRMLRTAVTESEIPYLFSAAPPRGSFDYCARAGGVPATGLVREVLADMAALASMVGRGNGLVVQEHALPRDRVRQVALIARHLGLPCTEAAASEIVDALGQAPSASAERLPPEESGLADAALSGASRLLLDRTCERIVATHPLFTVCDTGIDLVNPVDATGRNRMLIYGPSLCLPAGDWTARCVYSFSSGLIGIPMSVEVVHHTGGLHQVARTTFDVTAQGRLDVNIRFALAEPEALIQVRLWVDRTVFDGLVSLAYVEFKANPAGDEDFAAALPELA